MDTYAPPFVAGWSSLVARQAHNLKVAGSNPAPAPNLRSPTATSRRTFYLSPVSKTYRVYILQNPARRHYIGLSEDVATRLLQHNAGTSKWTAKYRPWTLVWQSDEQSLSEARKLETLLKRQKGGKGFFQLTGLDPSGS